MYAEKQIQGLFGKDALKYVMKQRQGGASNEKG
jgi:hypothetical protein